MLTDKQRYEFQKTLKDRFYVLRKEVSQELLKSDEQSYIELAGKVHDREEESVADLLVDLQLASIDRHIEEIRDIDAALISIAERSYGICSDCEDDIDMPRLQAYPTAKRCLTCQERHEKNDVLRGHASL